MQKRKNFIFKNESFVCLTCQAINNVSGGIIRNHCYNCLNSLHVDEEVPGDRASDCHGIMPAIKAYQQKGKGWMILHRCQLCQKEIPNKLASDDNWDQVIKLTNQPC